MAQNKERIVQYIQNKFSSMETEKNYMNPLFDKVGSHVNLRYERQEGTDTKGEFTTRKIWDTTAINAAMLMSAAILNTVFPSAKRTFLIRPKDFVSDSKSVKEWFNKTNDKFSSYLDNPKTNLYNSLCEIITDFVLFGTTSLVLNEIEKADYFTELPIRFRSMPLRTLYIDESEEGVIDTIYYKLEYTVQQLVNKYGIENVSSSVRKKFNSKSVDALSEKVYVIQAVEPAKNIYLKEKTPAGKTYASIHIEIDTEHILKESGFDYLPIIPARLEKRSSEIWGRSPSISALSDIYLANILTEAIVVATEKKLDPPIGVFSNGTFGTTIDTSAGAVNVITQIGANNTDPVFPINLVGDIREAASLLADTKSAIQRHYYLDLLFDMGSTRERTLGEVNIQNDLRGRALGAIYARIETELIVPLIEKTFDILFHIGWFGAFKNDDKYIALVQSGVPENKIMVIPEELKAVLNRNNKNNTKNKTSDNKIKKFPVSFYDIAFISPASRLRNREEVEGMTGFLQSIFNVFQVQPEILDSINLDNFVKRMAELFGTDVALLNSLDVVNEIKQKRNQQLQQQSQIQLAEVQSKMNRDKAMADSMTAATFKKLNMGG